MELDLHREWGSSPRFVLIGDTKVKLPLILSVPVKVKLPIRKWIQTHGFEWAQAYVKQLGVWAIHVLNGERCFHLDWIRKETYRGFRIPRYEVMRALVDAYVASNLKMIRVIMSYLKSWKVRCPLKPNGIDSIIRSPKFVLSNKHLEYLLAGVQLPRVPLWALESERFIMSGKSWALPDGSTCRGPICHRPEFIMENGNILMRTVSSEHLYENYAQLPDGSPSVDSSFISDTGVKITLGGNCRYTVSVPEFRKKVGTKSLGKLSVVYTQGKARVVLIGDYRAQLKCYRLGNFLREYLWGLPEVASGNQQIFETRVRSWLSRGYFCASLDQSEFTDRLSLDAQIKVLSTMGCDPSFFSFLKYGFWYQPNRFRERGGNVLKQATYSNGQPMGLFVSFSMAELLHYLVCRRCCDGFGSEFVICGDDVVLANKDKTLLNRSVFWYKKWIVDRLGGKMNDAKCIIGRVAEGVGKLFLSQGTRVAAVSYCSGKVSPTEMRINPVLVKSVSKMTDLGRALLYHFYCSPCVVKRYTQSSLRAFWDWILNFDLSELDLDIVREFNHRIPRPDFLPNFPIVDQNGRITIRSSKSLDIEWDSLSPTPKGLSLIRSLKGCEKSPFDSPVRFKRVSKEALLDALETTSIKRLIKRSNDEKKE